MTSSPASPESSSAAVATAASVAKARIRSSPLPPKMVSAATFPPMMVSLPASP